MNMVLVQQPIFMMALGEELLRKSAMAPLDHRE